MQTITFTRNPEHEQSYLEYEMECRRRILLVEADEATRRLACETLTGNGYDLHLARDAQSALNYIDRSGLPHLAIVDLKTPGMGARRFCKIVRSYADLPILLLTSGQDSKAITPDLRRNADDILSRPFTPRQLDTRAARLLRMFGDSLYPLAPVIPVDAHLEVDFVHQAVLVDGLEFGLTPLENKLLFVLMRAAPRILTYTTLIERVWGAGNATEDVLRVHLHALRRKLGGQDGRTSYIDTIRGLGYRFHPYRSAD